MAPAVQDWPQQLWEPRRDTGQATDWCRVRLGICSLHQSHAFQREVVLTDRSDRALQVVQQSAKDPRGFEAVKPSPDTSKCARRLAWKFLLAVGSGMSPLQPTAVVLPPSWQPIWCTETWILRMVVASGLE